MKKLAVRGLCLAFALVFGLAALAPARVRAEERPPEVGAEAYVVMDADTGQVLVSKNADLLGYPASITKILTLGLVLENVDYPAKKGEVLVASDTAIDALIPRASMIALGRGEAATLEDLLYATMLESANDAANVLAEYVGGSIAGFCQLMNDKAAALGLTGSHFTNPSGQPEDEHFTTARDMAAILKWALSIDGFAEIFSAQAYSMGASNMQPGGRTFRNVNMVSIPSSSYYCPGVVGSKTGYTDQARYTLATDVVRGDKNLICVVLGCPFNDEKYTSTNALLDYCFNNFRRVSVPASDIVTHSVPVYGGGDKSLGQIDVFAQGEVSFLLHNSLSPTLAQFTYSVPEKYVIGQPFAPTATLLLGDVSQQDGASFAAVPLTWEGLDQILAENTTFGALGRMAEERPALFWFGILLPTLLAFLLVGRVAYVQYRRQKRRQRRLEAARAQLPIRIAERPLPPKAPASPRTAYRRPSTPTLRVAKGGTDEAPRRVGRAR